MAKTRAIQLSIFAPENLTLNGDSHSNAYNVQDLMG
jgi:hypothetical protein